MKNLFIMMLGIICLISCSSDDDNPVNNNSIVGKWKLTKVTTEMTTNNIYAIGEGTDYNGFMTFEDQPNKVYGEGEVMLEIKVYMDGVLLETMTQTISLANQFETGQWEISENTLTLSGSNSSVSVALTELTGSSLKFRYTPNDTNVVNYEFTKVN